MTIRQSYRYIGADDLLDLNTDRQCVRRQADVLSWIATTSQRLQNQSITATFVIDTEGWLWIADRRSEHVACARGGRVLSAGEMTFDMQNGVSVTDATNQSLGYCPEPESWLAVADALTRADIPGPPDFTNAYIIRLCETCKTKNIVKEGVFECEVCESALSGQWNLDPACV
ncbi:MAG: hypothetical protein ABIY70_21965 [Capsulimonas sp.]|uniref:hypothetical protein n=1 Tax=Capsulimonas sp. TaxID=2494211 RepID=UPI00326642C5